MRYTVVWLPSAEAKLALIWIQAADRAAITRAANRIDILLRNSPENQGQEENGRYRLVVHPLAVLFQVSPDDCLVRVVDVEEIV